MDYFGGIITRKDSINVMMAYFTWLNCNHLFQVGVRAIDIDTIKVKLVEDQ
jgi:hypothetical protein